MMGPSGSGKTTLLRCAAGLLRPDTGSIEVAGKYLETASEAELAHLRLHSIGFVEQTGGLFPELSIRENVGLPLRLRRENNPRRVDEVLEQLGLLDCADQRASDLSGGEVQRTAIARAVVGNPVLVLADEPTGALDEDNSDRVTELLRDVCRLNDAGLLVATHDSAVAARMDSITRLVHGRLENVPCVS